MAPAKRDGPANSAPLKEEAVMALAEVNKIKKSAPKGSVPQAKGLMTHDQIKTTTKAAHKEAWPKKTKLSDLRRETPAEGPCNDVAPAEEDDLSYDTENDANADAEDDLDADMVMEEDDDDDEEDESEKDVYMSEDEYEDMSKHDFYTMDGGYVSLKRKEKVSEEKVIEAVLADPRYHARRKVHEGKQNFIATRYILDNRHLDGKNDEEIEKTETIIPVDGYSGKGRYLFRCQGCAADLAEATYSVVDGPKDDSEYRYLLVAEGVLRREDTNGKPTRELYKIVKPEMISPGVLKKLQKGECIAEGPIEGASLEVLETYVKFFNSLTGTDESRAKIAAEMAEEAAKKAEETKHAA